MQATQHKTYNHRLCYAKDTRKHTTVHTASIIHSLVRNRRKKHNAKVHRLGAVSISYLLLVA